MIKEILIDLIARGFSSLCKRKLSLIWVNQENSEPKVILKIDIC